MTLFEFLQKESQKSKDLSEQKIKNKEIESIFTHQYEDEELPGHEQED